MQPLPRPNRDGYSQGNGAHDQHQNETRPSLPPQHSTSTVRDLTRASTSTNPNPEPKKKRRHRGGKRKKNRRQSFAAPSETSALEGPLDPLVQVPENDDAYHNTTGFYGSSPGRRRPTIGNANMSDESMDSEALLDHRDQPSMRPRRDSRLLPYMFSTSQRSPSHSQSQTHPPLTRKRHRSTQAPRSDGDDEDNDDDAEEATDRTPLITGAAQHRSPTSDRAYGLYRQKSNNSNISSTSNHNRRRGQTMGSSFPKYGEDGHDVNNPPSHPPSPSLDAHPDDVMVATGDFLTRSPSQRRMAHARDALIDIEGDGLNAEVNSAPPSPRLQPGGNQRNRHMGHGDVCFPGEEMSEMADDDEHLSRTTTAASRGNRRARRQREWPQLWAFDEWSREEKEFRDGERRAKKISEPMLVQGRLRPTKPAWHRNEEDAPFRYTYFNEEFESTIHAQTISELVQPGAGFRQLFIPDPPELSDSSESEDGDEDTLEMSEQVGRKEDEAGLLSPRSHLGQSHENKAARFESTLSDGVKNGSREHSGKSSGQVTPQRHAPKAKKYGPRPTFWLDVQSPTDQEMRVLCKAFGIHALTSEDIMMQEAREKVELFRNYYFINYRTFEQDPNSEDYLEPVNMYVCVFRYGIVTFHFSQIPHPANVRRRIRQLTDYLILSADWISYAIIDDITDVYQPLIHNIESEVDEIDDLILQALQETNELKDASSNNPLVGDNKSAVSEASSISGIDMLRRIGECRKKVMSLYRLLGQKADVIKGFAKRCNEQWDVAPKSEIGLYLGDIQDHIVTMSSNLNHYETLLGRAHSNYLAQVSIRMNERQELTADVLGKLTVIGTIVLPMNIICGMWGMNVKVPGQEIDNLHWFWAITAGLAVFAITCFYWCKKVYKIV